MVETNGERWLREHNVPDDLLDKYLRGERDDGMKSVFFIQVLLSCGMEFDIVFREKNILSRPFLENLLFCLPIASVFCTKQTISTISAKTRVSARTASSI